MEPKARFKAVREHFNLSMGAFGERIGLSTSGVSAIEYGTRVMSEKHIKLICAAFPDISEEWLRAGEGEMLLPTPIDNQAISARVAREYGSDPLLRAFMTTYLQLDDAKRDLLLEIAQGFTSALKDALNEGKPAPDLSEYVHSRGDALAAARANEPPVPESKAQSS